MTDAIATITPYGYCKCGCGEKTEISRVNDAHGGYIAGVPRDFRSGHNRRGSAMDHFTRYIEQDLGFESDCWIWTGARSGSGYGQIWMGESQRMALAHRVFYERANGEIADGLHLDHLCRNPACVNPDHLEPVTPRENTLRGIGPSAVNAVKTHCHRGHEFTEENTIRASQSGGRACRKCRAIRQAEYRARKKAA